MNRRDNKKERPKRQTWADVEKKIQGKSIRIYAKILNDKGDTIIYEGIYLGRVDRYHFLLNCIAYKYNMFSGNKEKIGDYKQLAIKEDIIGLIELSE